MYLRISSLVIASGLLAACKVVSVEPEGSEIECAIGAGSDFAAVCTLERARDEGEGIYLIHSPDGGFRRLRFDPEAGEFGAVDGADELEIIAQDGTFAEFSIADDRYRVPHAALRDAPE
ncbi:MAG: hypothetical protein ABJP70_09610 [Erythrobacter sp.]